VSLGLGPEAWDFAARRRSIGAMKSSVVVVYSSLLAFGLVTFHERVKQHFLRPDAYLRKIERLEKSVLEERLAHLWTVYEFEDFRQYVATLLPEAVRAQPSQEKSFPLRSLASVVQQSENQGLQEYRGDALFFEGQRHFRGGHLREAIASFESLIREHAYSGHLVEALFLKLESHFRLRDYDQVIALMQTMVDAFPTSELTGYAMLRVGQIYEEKDRADEAVRIYQTVLKSFPERGLATAAREKLK
jgi:TolA-binding protein